MGEMAKLCVSFTLLHAFYTRFTLFFGGHPDPEIRGEPGLKKNFFRPFGAHFNLKIMKGDRAPQSPPLDPPLQHTFVTFGAHCSLKIRGEGRVPRSPPSTATHVCQRGYSGLLL